MRWKRTLVSLLAIGVFCAYLASTCSDLPEREAVGPGQREAILLSRPAILAETLAPPAPETRVVRVAPDTSAPKAPEDAAPRSHEVWAVVTAYCPCRRCCGRHANGRTSTGTSAWLRGLATDPHVIPYGTRIYIPGYGMSVVDDTGAAMRRTWRRSGMVHVDVRMTYHYEARRWGRKVMKIRVYEPAD